MTPCREITLLIFLQTGGEADKTRKRPGKRSKEKECFIGLKEGGHWEPAKHSGRWGGGVSAVQSALTDVLYIACHFILQEYWGVAKLKPGRYSNPSPAHIGVGGWGLKSHLEACSQYSSYPVLFMKGTSPRPLSRTDQSSGRPHATAPRPGSQHRNANTLSV